MAKKWVCPVCGYVYEGENPPEKCPQCKVPGSKFKMKEETEGLNFACEHEVGVAKAIPEGEEGAFVLQGLKDHFTGECTEVGMYLAMARQADREGYPEVSEAFRRYAYLEIAKVAKKLNLDAIHDTVHEMAKDEARHGAGFQGLYNRYFK